MHPLRSFSGGLRSQLFHPAMMVKLLGHGLAVADGRSGAQPCLGGI